MSMKKLQDLDNFTSDDNLDEAAYVPKKAATKFEVTTALKNVAKMEKSLIDMKQMLTEMSDSIMKINFNELDADSIEILNGTRFVLNNMTKSLTKIGEKSKDSGLMANSVRLRKKLEKLKDGLTLKK